MGATFDISQDFILDDPTDTPSIGDIDGFADLMRRVRAGSEQAAWKLVQDYGGYIRRAVRRVLNQKLRPKFDSLDFVQLVWQSFFRMREQVERFEDPRHFVAYVAGMANNKVRMEIRRRMATEKHDVEREVPLHHRRGKDRQKLVGREPEPADVAIAQERWEQLLNDQPSHCRRILQLKLKGHTSVEIAAMLEIDPQTVRRFLKRQLGATVV